MVAVFMATSSLSLCNNGGNKRREGASKKEEERRCYKPNEQLRLWRSVQLLPVWLRNSYLVSGDIRTLFTTGVSNTKIKDGVLCADGGVAGGSVRQLSCPRGVLL